MNGVLRCIAGRRVGTAPWLLVLAALAAQAGCATTHRPAAAIEPGARLSVVVTSSASAARVSPTRAAHAVHDDRPRVSGEFTGAAAGTVLGGIIGAGACAAALAFAPLCIAAMAASGMVAGGVTGASVDALSLHDSGIVVRNQMIEDGGAQPFVDALRREVQTQAARHWSLEDGGAANTLMIDLRDIKVSGMTHTREVQFTAYVEVRVTHADGTPDGKGAYSWSSAFSSPAVWFDNRSGVRDTWVDTASRQLALQIVADLAAQPAGAKTSNSRP